MGVYVTSADVNGAATTNAGESTVLTTPKCFASAPRPVRVSGTIVITVGTGTTALTVKVRRTSDNAIVNTPYSVTAAANQQMCIQYDFLDKSGSIETAAGDAYSLTLQQTAGTSAGAVNYANMVVEQLS